MADKNKIKVIAMDLDGTLTQHKQPPEEKTKETLIALSKKYKLLMVGAGQVYRQIAVPHFVSGVLEQGLACDDGIVYQQRNGAELCFRGFDHGGYSGAVCHIRLYGNGPAAHVTQSGYYLLGSFFLLNIVDADVPAFAAKLQGNAPANAAGSAGYQCDFVPEKTSFWGVEKSVAKK